MKERPKEKRDEIKDILDRLLKANDVIRIRYLRGELKKSKLFKTDKDITVAVAGIMVEAVKSKKLGEEIAPVLLERMKTCVRNPMIYIHFLEMLRLEHEIVTGEKIPDPDEDVPRSIEAVQEEVDLKNIHKQWAKVMKEAKEEVDRYREKWNDNEMFG